MPNGDRGFNLQDLKTDSNMWMRFAMPSKNGGHLENVFKDKDNPFEKNYQAAVETMEKLAAEGKLYLRDLGRSRHFHKVEKDGEELKLGEKHEMKLSNRTSDPVLGLLMRMSRGYFKWIGLDRISNWFDGRLQRRAEIQELDNRYKVEYKSLTSEEKAELKALRKQEAALRKHEAGQLKALRGHEKNLSKLDKAKELANETKKNLDAIRGKETTETLEELEAMLAKADQRATDNRSPEKEFARRALFYHEENLQKVGEARNNANEKKKALDVLRGKETTETLEQLEQMLSNANQIEQRRGGPLNANEREVRKALRDYVKSLRELEKTENKADKTKKKLDETLGRETTETIEQLKEMLGISPEEINERRALRRHVESLRKLAKAEQKVEATRQKLDGDRSNNDPKSPKEVDSPLSKAPHIKDKTNTMQPTLMGDQPVQNQIPVPPKLDVKAEQNQIPVPPKLDVKAEQNQIPVPPKLDVNPVQNQIPVPPKLDVNPNLNKTGQQEITGEKKEEQQQEKKAQLFIEGVEITEETAKQFPPHIVEAFKLIQQLINEKEANKNVNQQPSQEQKEEVKENVKQPDMETQPEVKAAKQEEPVAGDNQNVAEPGVTDETLHKPTVDGNVPRHEMDAPLKDGADLEPEKVDIQERHKDQAQQKLQEQLATEKRAMDAVLNWKEFVANALFSHEEASTAKDFYQMVNQNNASAGADFLSGTVFGILSNNTVNPEQKQKAMDALLRGEPLGNENAKLINDGIKAYNEAVARKTNGYPDHLEKMLADSMRELSLQASRETTLSPRHVLIGRLLSNAAQMTNENNLELHIDEDEFKVIKGAGTLADVALRYHDARQTLGNDLQNIGSNDNRDAVRDLLMGNAMEKLIQQDKSLGQSVTNTQKIMGNGLWNIENLQTYTNNTAVRRGIQPKDIQALLEKPNSTKALSLGTKTVTEIVNASQEDYLADEKAIQKDMNLSNEERQPAINPLGAFG